MRQVFTQFLRSVGSLSRSASTPTELAIPFPLTSDDDEIAPTREPRSSAERAFLEGNVMIW